MQGEIKPFIKAYLRRFFSKIEARCIKIFFNVRKVSTLSAGMLMAQAINFLTLLFLTRHASAEAIALLALLNANVSALAPLISLRFEVAYVVSAEVDEQISFLLMSSFVSFLVSFILFVVYFWGLLPIQDLSGVTAPSFIVFICVIILNNLTLFGVANLNSQSAYNRMAIILVLQALVYLAATMTFSLSLGDIGAILGLLISYFVACLFYFSLGSVRLLPFPSFAIIWSVFRRFSAYPLISMPTGLLNGYYQVLPILFLTTFFSASETAFFFLAQRFIASPLGIVSSSVSNILLKDFSDMKYGERVKTFNRYAIFLCIIASLAFLFFAALPQSVYAFLFGVSEIDKSVIILLSMCFLVRFSISPLTTILPAVGQIRLEAVWKLPSFLILLVFLIFGADRINFQNFILQFVILDVSLYLAYALLCHIAVRGVKS
jgi:O-antigen/teichoic acid export membrane protein